MDLPPENDICSVCHDDFTLACQANCSHWFCGHCILGVWQYGSALEPCKCPICRRVITLLIPAEAAQQWRDDPESSEVLGNIERYNRLFGGGSPNLGQVFLGPHHVISDRVNNLCSVGSMNFGKKTIAYLQGIICYDG